MRNNLFYIFLLQMVITSAEANTADNDERIYIAFNSAVTRLSGDEARLDDFLNIQVTKDSSTTLKQLETAVYPFKNKTSLNAEYIVRFIEEKLGIDVNKVSWRGDKHSELRKIATIEKHELANEKYWQEKIERALSKSIKETLNATRVEVKMMATRPAPSRFKGVTNIGIKYNQSMPVRSRMAVWVELHKQDNIISETALWFRVKVFAKRLVAKQNIVRHRRVTLENFYQDEIEITLNAEDYVSSFSSIYSIWTTKRITKGLPLKSYYLEKEPLIKKNQVLIIEYHATHIHLEVKGKALANAFLGDDLMILVEGSHQPVKGKVMSKNRVRVANDV